MRWHYDGPRILDGSGLDELKILIIRVEDIFCMNFVSSSMAKLS